MIKRHMGIECLRIVSMFMIVILHTLGQGGILSNLEMFSRQYYSAWLLEIVAYCSVNCYALISGYVGINSSFKYSRIILLWLQVIFYTVVITLFFTILFPEKITGDMWLNALFPFTTKQYWYMSAYFGMFFLIPFMNAGINTFSKNKMRSFLVTVVIFYLFMPTVMGIDTFNLGGGYSMIWLCLLYIIGGCIKKLDIVQVMSQKKAMVLFLLMIFTSWLSKCFLDAYHTEYGMTFVSFTSPTIFFAAVALLIFFLHIHIYNEKVVRIVNVFASISLGVYIIHVNPLIWNNIMWNFAADYANNRSIVMLIKIFIAAVVIYLGCSVIDLIRKRIFEFLKIAERCKMIENRVEKINEKR